MWYELHSCNYELCLVYIWNYLYPLLCWTSAQPCTIMHSELCIVVDTDMNANHTHFANYLCLRRYWHDEKKRKCLQTCTSSPLPSQCFCPQCTSVPERSNAPEVPTINITVTRVKLVRVKLPLKMIPGKVQHLCKDSMHVWLPFEEIIVQLLLTVVNKSTIKTTPIWYSCILCLKAGKYFYPFSAIRKYCGCTSAPM